MKQNVITIGIDLGSAYTKTALLKDHNLISHHIEPTSYDPEKTAKICINEVLRKCNLKIQQIDNIVSTGYSRRRIPIAKGIVSEITANARGALWVSHGLKVRTIIDIGGQDTKVIAIDEEGRVANFQMNDRCAAGTGRFLEVMARAFGFSMNDFAQMALKSKTHVEISNTCTVYARSEALSLLTRGIKLEDINMALHRAIVERVAIMARKVGINPVVLFDGGPANNLALRQIMVEVIGMEVYVPDHPQIVAAIGAAVIAAEQITNRNQLMGETQ